MGKRLSDDEKRVFTDRITELEAEVAGMQDKWTPPDEMAVHQNHMSLLKNENERLTDLNEEWRDRYKRKRAENIKTIARMDEEIDEYRNLYHLGEAKILSREAIIEQLSETELAQDNARLQEENTLLAEHNRALMEKGAHLSHGCGLDGCLFAKYVEQLTGGDEQKQNGHEPITLTQKEFDDLPNYSASLPTGTTVGKCWKAKLPTGEWLHRTYVEHPTDDNKVLIITRDIIISDTLLTGGDDGNCFFCSEPDCQNECMDSTGGDE